MRRVASLALVLVLVLAWGEAEAQTRSLQHDPFARPPLAGMNGAEPKAAVAHVARAEPPRTLKLTGVLKAGPGSLANVNGTMLRLGDSVNGYRLVEVRDRAAVFEKNNTRFTLDLPAFGKGSGGAEPPIVPAAAAGEGK